MASITNNSISFAFLCRSGVAKKMLIKCILHLISTQKQKRRFVFAYKPVAYVPGLAAHPWAAWNR